MSSAPGHDGDVRALIEQKKKELTERFGARFAVDRTIPPEVEYSWLCSVEEFEKQAENCKLVTVREYLGNPAPIPLSSLSADHIQEEIDTFREFLHSRGIEVCFAAGVTPAEEYRHLTEDLLDETIEDTRASDCYTVFVYGGLDGEDSPAVN